MVAKSGTSGLSVTADIAAESSLVYLYSLAARDLASWVGGGGCSGKDEAGHVTCECSSLSLTTVMFNSFEVWTSVESFEGIVDERVEKSSLPAKYSSTIGGYGDESETYNCSHSCDGCCEIPIR